MTPIAILVICQTNNSIENMELEFSFVPEREPLTPVEIYHAITNHNQVG